ncbi:hypothetical protein ONZ45_g14760 [Pleurotus djamor]|nr:hypothetical protein ONZ45_g14760 [Pleurotus djamor]
MSFWKWGSDSAKSIIVSIVYSLSSKYNVRRLEDSSYATWNAILFRLCQKHPDVFLICPQYGLYVSPKDPTNADTSFDSYQTTADNQASGVYVDNSIILPTLALREGSVVATVRAYLGSILTERPWAAERTLRVRKACVPVLVEEKRPPPRHCNIKVYLTQVVSSLDEAQTQAETQAGCLFSMRKFGHQDRVILVAATGGWWSFRVERRDAEPNALFNLGQYLSHLRENAQNEDRDDYAADPESELVSRAVAANGDQPNQQPGAKKQVDLEEQIDGEPATIKGLIKRIGGGPFSLENINRYWRAKTNTSFSHPEDAPFQQDGEWTSPMRLGTIVSDRYLKRIEDYLDVLATDELARRGLRRPV